MNLFDRVIQEYSRDKEEKVGKQIKEANTQDSSQISSMIKKAISSGHKVYLGGDWHLWRFDKNKKKVYQRSDFQSIINAYNNKVTDDDVFIYLGDLIDGECDSQKNELGAVLDSLKGQRVFVRGNNDLFPDEFYKQHGFKYVTPKFVYDDMLFTHIPESHNHKLNVHAHIHNSRRYWIQFYKMIDVAACDGRKKPVELDAVIKEYPNYVKTVRVIWAKVLEG